MTEVDVSTADATGAHDDLLPSRALGLVSGAMGNKIKLIRTIHNKRPPIG